MLFSGKFYLRCLFHTPLIMEMRRQKSFSISNLRQYRRRDLIIDKATCRVRLHEGTISLIFFVEISNLKIYNVTDTTKICLLRVL